MPQTKFGPEKQFPESIVVRLTAEQKTKLQAKVGKKGMSQKVRDLIDQFLKS